MCVCYVHVCGIYTQGVNVQKPCVFLSLCTWFSETGLSLNLGLTYLLDWLARESLGGPGPLQPPCAGAVSVYHTWFCTWVLGPHSGPHITQHTLKSGTESADFSES